MPGLGYRVSRLLLILPTATYRARDFLDAASRLDAEVVVASDHRQALAGVLGDRALRVDLRRPPEAAQAIAKLASRTPLDAVVAVDEQGVAVAALAAEELGLTHNSPEAVAASRDKVLMRAALAAAGVPQPDHRVVEGGRPVAPVVIELGPPCVLKPVALSASRGVIRVDSAGEAESVAERIRTIVADAGDDPAGPLLVERYAPGVEVAVEGMIRGGELEVVAVFDKPEPLKGPFFEETLYVTPSQLSTATLARIEEVMSSAVSALGLVEGPIHGELRVDNGEAVVLEVAARSIGGLCSRSLRFGLASSLEDLILRRALGLPLADLRREEAASGVMMLPIPRAGVFREVRGQSTALAVPNVTDIEISIAPGKPVTPLPEGDRYLGFLYARAERPAAVEDALREAHRRLKVIIEEPGPDPEIP